MKYLIRCSHQSGMKLRCLHQAKSIALVVQPGMRGTATDSKARKLLKPSVAALSGLFQTVDRNHWSLYYPI